jgi:uncharacterized coiled-coil protein SlyX
MDAFNARVAAKEKDIKEANRVVAVHEEAREQAERRVEALEKKLLTLKQEVDAERDAMDQITKGFNEWTRDSRSRAERDRRREADAAAELGLKEYTPEGWMEAALEKAVEDSRKLRAEKAQSETDEATGGGKRRRRNRKLSKRRRLSKKHRSKKKKKTKRRRR